MPREYSASVHMGCSKLESMTESTSKHSLPPLENAISLRDPVTGSSLIEDERFHFLQVRDWIENKGMLNVRAKTLHRRGVSREQHPRPEKAEEQLPQHYIDDVTEAIYSYENYEAYSESEHHTASTLGEWMSTSNGWTTGNTTERSSVESMGEDEFDKVASRTVRQLFGEIESMLFEGETREGQSHFTHLQTECQDWVSHFPHMRILGVQKIPPQDMGYQAMPRPAASNILQDIDDTHTVELSVSGRHMDILVPPINESSQSDQYSHLEEEIFAEDGYYEDIIAVDRLSAEEDTTRKTTVKRRRRFPMPPITPNAVVRDNISNAVFDTIWSEVIGWLRVVVKEIASVVITDREEKRSLDGMIETITNLSLAQDIPPPSREISMLQKTLNTGAKIGQSSLEGVLTISTKQLLNREKSNLNDTTDSLISVSARPNSSFFHNRRPQSVKFDYRKTPTRRHLPPLAIDRARTPNVEEDRTFPGVRGHRMVTVNDARTEISVISPPNMYRTMTLPPVVMESNEIPPIPHRKKLGTLRASSAVANKEFSNPFRERERSQLHMETRPSTTQTLYRSDTPLGFNRRSSTPMGFNNTLSHMRGGLTHFTGPSHIPHKIMNLGVTGSGINPQHEEDTFNQLQPHWGASHTHRRSRVLNMSSVR